jgi:hypothetical protein
VDEKSALTSVARRKPKAESSETLPMKRRLEQAPPASRALPGGHPGARQIKQKTQPVKTLVKRRRR